MPFLFWRLITESKAAGATRIDLGRSDLEQEGLINFKNRLGAGRKRLTYFRYPEASIEVARMPKRESGIRALVGLLPGTIASLGGRLLYRHMG